MDEQNVSLSTIAARLARRFVLGECLGSGATGMVFRANRVGGGAGDESASLVIKCFLRSFAADELVERFRRECRVLSHLDHEGVLRLVEYDVVDGMPYLVFPFVEGTTLATAAAERFSSGAVRERTGWALSVCREVAEALAYCHGRNVVHRDIKPENIFIDTAGKPIVIDFGLARCELMRTFKTRTGLLLGTPAYMAPELILGEAPSPASDVYALGIVLYALLTGTLPFTGTLAEQLREKLDKEAPPPRLAQGELDADVQELLCAMVRREPGKRLGAGEGAAIAAAVAKELAALEAQLDERDRAVAEASTQSAVGAPPLAVGAPPLAVGAPPLAVGAPVLAVAETIAPNEGGGRPETVLEAIAPDEGGARPEPVVGSRARADRKELASQRPSMAVLMWVLLGVVVAGLFLSHWLGGRTTMTAALPTAAGSTGSGTAMAGTTAAGTAAAGSTVTGSTAAGSTAAGSTATGSTMTGSTVTASAGIRVVEERVIASAEEFFALHSTAIEGDVQAMVEVARAYQKGMGVAATPERAMPWLRKAAAAGNARAMAHLGQALRDGFGVEQDLRAAVEWFEKSALAGDAYGMNYLAESYYSGKGKVMDPTKARLWFERAAEAGSLGAYVRLGDIYRHRRGVKLDLRRAYEYYRTAADAGSGWAMTRVADCYLNGDGVEKSPAKVYEWSKRGSAAGNGYAMKYLGDCYARGIGVEQDYERAIESYRISADCGNAAGAFSLGRLYLDGIGVRRDIEKAKEWCEKAANDGNMFATNVIADIYGGKYGGPIDKERHAYWKKRAQEKTTSSFTAYIDILTPSGETPRRNSLEQDKNSRVHGLDEPNGSAAAEH